MSLSKLCEFCNEDNVSFLCADCEQEICERCKGIHSRQKATKDHAVTSLTNKAQADVKASLEGLLPQLQSKVSSLRGELSNFDVCITEMVCAQTGAIDECKRIRAACHRTLDERFDALEDKIQELTSPRIQRRYEDQTKLKQQVDELQKKQRKVSQTLANNDSKPDDTGRLIEEVKAMLEVKQPTSTFMIPQVSVELNASWESVQPCHVTSATDTAAQIPARRRGIDDDNEAAQIPAQRRGADHESKASATVKQSAKTDSAQQRTERPREDNTKTQVMLVNTLWIYALSAVMIDFDINNVISSMWQIKIAIECYVYYV